jgi:muramoyltetrapeptide carboxypeptidase
VKSGIAYLGRADIGHDTSNKVVPFGLATAPAQQ